MQSKTQPERSNTKPIPTYIDRTTHGPHGRYIPGAIFASPETEKYHRTTDSAQCGWWCVPRLTTTQMNFSRNRTSQPPLWPSTIAPLPTLPHTPDQSAPTSAVPCTRRRHKREYVSLADRPQVDPTALDFQIPGRAYMSDDWRMDQELHSRKADEAEQRKRSKS
nr:hypothetical protein B0A51_09607 [Rachicladosporium sp. CCFEE 5018]